MTVLFIILIVLLCVILSLIVLVQNPKGGGLAGSIAGFSNQFMGVKQTTDVLEKGTWIFAAIIAVLCITSRFFISSGGSAEDDRMENVGPAPVQSAPQQTNPKTGVFPGTQQPNKQAPATNTDKK